MKTTDDTRTSRLKIGFVGAGNMGAPMIGHLLRGGHAVRALARHADVARSLNDMGAMVGADIESVAGEAQVLCINVTSTPDVEQVLFGSGGALAVLSEGSVVIDFSTISAAATRDIAVRLRERGIAMLDAPVSGGVKGAQAASLSIMVGGDAEVLARMRCVLNLLGTTITHVGVNGAGQVAKACNQIVQVVNIEGIAEAMRFAAANDVDLGCVLSAISAGMAGSKMLDLMGPRMAQRNFDAGIEARLHAKDFGLVTEMAAQLGIDLPAVSLVGKQLDQLMQHGWGRDDTSSLLRVLEQGGAK